MGTRAAPRLGRGLRGFAALAFALCLVAAFPFRAGDFRFEAGILFGWIALVPFALALRGLTPARAFWLGTASGTLAYAGILFWIYVVVTVHGHAAAWVGVLSVALLAFYVGIHIGLVGAVVAALTRVAGRAGFLVLPAAWVVAEQLRSFDLFSGFPWGYLGYSVWKNGPARELLQLGGVYGVSFLLALTAALVAERRILAAAVLVAAAHLTGFALGVGHTRAATDSDSKLRVGIVQANIPQDEKWDPARARDSFEAHLESSRLLAASGSLDLIVWPEASVPILLESDRKARAEVSEVAREGSVSLLLGGMAVEQRQQAPRARSFYNSAFLVLPDGRFFDRYDKSLLVPFGEYVPLRGLLGWLSGVATGLASGDVSPGPGPRAIVLPGLGPDHALAPLICYEVIYPDLVRRAVRDGARVLVNITNDAWYGSTSAPHQFLAIAVARSAETGLPMVRAANSGVSALVAPGGRIVDETPIFERRALRGVVGAARSGSTLYTRFGNWVLWISWSILIGLGGRYLVARNRKHPRREGSSSNSGGSGARTAEASLTSTAGAPDSRN
ncbi:MAG: apolipoprotein N-acyltransferase [Myxococcales bacterium]|nr:apolipoprotein N-acyltransferase [Myxococcales bacterium]